MTGTEQPRPAVAARVLAADPQLAGLRRSLEFYYGDPGRDAAMDLLYRRFVGPGDLVFDIGAHVGDRVGSFRRLGARVVAVEPQPLCARAVRLVYADDPAVSVVQAACGDTVGSVRMYINSANPTVSTASAEFVEAADGANGWSDQVWDAELDVPVTTVASLVAEHGPPAFVKIDVEGFEEAVLAGLHDPVPALSFEFTTIQRDTALRCLRRLAALGDYRFDVALGESQRLTFDRWLTGTQMEAHLRELPQAANAGDVYAVLLPARTR